MVPPHPHSWRQQSLLPVGKQIKNNYVSMVFYDLYEKGKNNSPARGLNIKNIYMFSIFQALSTFLVFEVFVQVLSKGVFR